MKVMGLYRYLAYRKPQKYMLMKTLFELTKLIGALSKRSMLPLKWRGITMLLSMNDESIRECFEYTFGLGIYELEKDFSPKKGWVVVDVGAHHGFYAIKAAKAVSSSGKVIAIEPHPDNFRRLMINVSLNKIKNVIPIKAICADSCGQGRLYVHPHLSVMHSIVFPQQNSITVKQVTLDALLESLGVERVDILKLDVEGAEIKVLRGASNLLRRKKILRIVAELHSDALLKCFMKMLKRHHFHIKAYPIGHVWLAYASLCYK